MMSLLVIILVYIVTLVLVYRIGAMRENTRWMEDINVFLKSHREEFTRGMLNDLETAIDRHRD